MLGKLLLVEGTTDKYLIEEIAAKATPKLPKFAVTPSKNGNEEGIEALLRSLPVTLKSADPEDILGIVVDADLNASGRWQRIRQILENAGYQQISTDLAPGGQIIASDEILPRFGLWIMPNNQEKGILEDFIRQLIHKQDKLQPVVNQMLDDLKEKELQLFTEVKRPKAFIKTWLAWQENPEMSYGIAISKKLFLTDALLCQQFISWLDRLFNG